MRRLDLGAAMLFLALLPPAAARGQGHWPQWRGPQLNGVSSATGLPTTWSAEQNVVWKTALPSWSGGTPVIWGDRIFVTSPSAPDPEAVEAQEERERQEREAQAAQGQDEDRGRRGRGGRGRWGRDGGRDPGGAELMLLCIDRRNGAVLWQRTLDTGNALHRKGNNTSPSPVTDGTHVWVVTGTGAVTALDMDGKQVWQHKLQDEYGRFGLNWGYASSPLLYDGKLIVEVLHGMRTDDPSYVIAFDAKTGRVLWRQERPTDAPMESPDAYTTPVVLQHGGRTQIVVSGGDYVTGHDPDDGREVWRVAGLNPRGARNYRIVASPLVVDGMIYAPTRVRPLLALRAPEDPATLAPEVAWKWDETGSPDVPTPVCDGTYFYMVNDSGMATCLDARTGKALWGPQRTVQGTVSSSPVLADGKIYFTNEEAVTVVLAAGPEYQMLASNELDGTYTLSSPVPCGSQLFVRTATHLYCIEQGPAEDGGGS